MSTIKIYDVPFKEEQHFIIEQKTVYLQSKKLYEFNNFQYVKNALVITLKFDLSQEYLDKLNANMNYLSITQDGSIWYYFIHNQKWISKNTIALELHLDTLNTFELDLDYSFNEKTKILREHKDRFDISNYEETQTILKLIPEIDWYSEGINPTLYANDNPMDIQALSHTVIQPKRNWYLVYRTSNFDDNANNPVNCYCCSDSALPINYSQSGTTIDVTLNMLEDNKYYYLVYEDNGINTSFTYYPSGVARNDMLNATTKRVVVFYKSGSIINVIAYEYNTNKSYIDKLTLAGAGNTHIFFSRMAFARVLPYLTNNYGDIQNAPKFQINAGTISALQVAPISEIDKTDSRLIKIIELPYPPANLYEDANNVIHFDSSIWSYDNTAAMLKLNDLSTNLSNTFKVIKKTPIDNDILKLRRDIIKTDYIERYVLDPKLLNSEFYQPKFLYDSFGLVVKLENLSVNAIYDLVNYKTFEITFTPSNTFNSRFLFTFNDLKDIAITNEDFSNLLVVSRNNEIPIYSSSYLNYIRNGFNYDVKNKQRDDISNLLSTMMTTIGAVASIASTPVTGAMGIASGVSLGTGAVSQFVHTATSAVASEQNIQKNINQLKAQSTSISSCDAVDLMNQYGHNKLQYILYTVSGRVRKALDDLFYYNGYKEDRLGIPNVHSRLYFNYIQCEAVLDKSTNIQQEYLNDIINKYAMGVTFMHNFDGSYDIEQRLENLEHSVYNLM